MLSAISSATRSAISFFVSLLVVFAPVFAQQTQTTPALPPPQDDEEVVRVSAELVQTDVMVFDRAGRFVDGLRPDQFELKVDGQPHPIAFFERIEAGTINEDAQIAAARGGARRSSQAEGAALPLDRGRTLAFFVDDLHLSHASAVRAQRALQKFVEEEIGQNDVAAVASSSGQIGFLQQFTDHKGVLRAAVGRITPRNVQARDFERPPMSPTQALAIQRNDSFVLNTFVDLVLRDNPMMRREVAENSVVQRSRSMMAQINQTAAHTLNALEQVVRRSAPLPGRKLLFFISDGFVFDESDGRVRERLRRVADAAARAGVVIYSIDAFGLRSNMPDATEQPVFDPTMVLTNQALGDVTAYHSPLQMLATETGGRAIINTNNPFGPGVKGALRETSKYYLLAWRPEVADAKGNPRFRRVEANVKGRSDLRVIVRRGFYSTPPPEISQSGGSKKERDKEKSTQSSPEARGLSAEQRALQAALFSAQPRAELPTSLWLSYTDTVDAGTVLAVLVEIGRETLAASPAGDGERRFDILGALYDVQGKLAGGFKQNVSFASQAGGALPQRLVYSNQTALAPGLYQVRVATRDARTGHTGSAADWIEIPDLKRERMTIGGTFFAERTAATGAEQNIAQAAQQPVSGADRRFARTSWLRFLTHIYTPAATARPDLALQVQVFRDDQPVFTAPLRKVPDENITDPKRVPYAAELALGDFPAGRYALQLTAIDRNTKQTATQRIIFIIE